MARRTRTCQALIQSKLHKDLFTPCGDRAYRIFTDIPHCYRCTTRLLNVFATFPELGGLYAKARTIRGAVSHRDTYFDQARLRYSTVERKLVAPSGTNGNSHTEPAATVE